MVIVLANVDCALGGAFSSALGKQLAPGLGLEALCELARGHVDISAQLVDAHIG
ncbi:MAG TPA: hypothetical protein VGO04_09690 [Ensifer sp.]|jgi:hypothetical protein|uniref:hypothetical protein n=1 Tax=Ensifer sp. TaxID=1872086 RepID=UPI002E156F7B|nr:hypothetical protein [Ensifer sp.]